MRLTDRQSSPRARELPAKYRRPAGLGKPKHLYDLLLLLQIQSVTSGRTGWNGKIGTLATRDASSNPCQGCMFFWRRKRISLIKLRISGRIDEESFVISALSSNSMGVWLIYDFPTDSAIFFSGCWSPASRHGQLSNKQDKRSERKSCH